MPMARVRKVMLANVPTLKKEAKILEAAKLLAEEQTGCVVIVENNEPVGIVTALDFVRNAVSKGKNFEGSISKIMSSPVTFMEPDMKLDEALKIIDTKRYRRYPVAENGKLAGLVTKKEIVNAMSDNLKLHRNIQNAVLALFVFFELFIFMFAKYFSK